MTIRICVFEGDDAAPESIAATREVLSSLDVDLSFTTPPVEAYADSLQSGTVPDDLRLVIESADTVLFGAGSDLHIPLLRYLRWEYGGGTYANLRPVRYFEGATSPLRDPGNVDYLIIRENLEGLYVRAEGDLLEAAAALDATDVNGTPLTAFGSGKYALRVTSEAHTRRFARFACETAAGRAKDGESLRLTCATKSNVLPGTDGLFERTVERTAQEYDELAYEHLYVDNAAARLVADPGRFDVLVTPNFSGDVLSDVGAGTAGGLGVAPSGCYGDDGAYFEPVHGSAPDIAGEGRINPTATLLSAAMLLEYVDAPEAATRLVRAIESTYRDGTALTPDQGGTATTGAFAMAVADRL